MDYQDLLNKINKRHTNLEKDLTAIDLLIQEQLNLKLKLKKIAIEEDSKDHEEYRKKIEKQKLYKNV